MKGYWSNSDCHIGQWLLSRTQYMHTLTSSCVLCLCSTVLSIALPLFPRVGKVGNWWEKLGQLPLCITWLPFHWVWQPFPTVTLTHEITHSWISLTLRPQNAGMPVFAQRNNVVELANTDIMASWPLIEELKVFPFSGGVEPRNTPGRQVMWCGQSMRFPYIHSLLCTRDGLRNDSWSKRGGD